VSYESRRLAGLLLVILPTVMVGGVSILTLLINDPAYMRNPLRQDLWRAGHAHAGVLLLLSLIVLRYADEADLTARLKGFVRTRPRQTGSSSWRISARPSSPLASSSSDSVCCADRSA
jgi:hypothetical protein